MPRESIITDVLVLLIIKAIPKEVPVSWQGFYWEMWKWKFRQMRWTRYNQQAKNDSLIETCGDSYLYLLRHHPTCWTNTNCINLERYNLEYGHMTNVLVLARYNLEYNRLTTLANLATVAAPSKGSQLFQCPQQKQKWPYNLYALRYPRE